MLNHQEPPIFCDTTALTPEQFEQHTADSYQLFAAVREVRELPDGYSFRLPEDDTTLASLFEFIRDDRRCCSFFRFGVEVEPQLGPVWLKISGGTGVKEMFAAEVAPLLNAEVAAAAGLIQPSASSPK